MGSVASNTRNADQHQSEPKQPLHKPKAFHVPNNLAQVLDFSEPSGTPESAVKRQLLSRACGRNSVAVVGMGGAGKTTILKAIGHDKDIWARYPDGIWFISLGQHATVSTLIEQLEEFVRDACPAYVEEFLRLTAKKAHTVMLGKLFDRLEGQNLLLIFDDIWDVSGSFNTLLSSFCAAVRGLPSGSTKLLTSTRDLGLARVPRHDVQINVIPDASDTATAQRLLCHYANLDPSDLQSLSNKRKKSMENIITTCAGLPLALGVAGTSILREMDQLQSGHKEEAWVRCWNTLSLNVQQLGDTESPEHSGLYASLQSSLNAVEKKCKIENISMAKIFRSLSVLQKQSSIPLNVLQTLWNLDQKDAKHCFDLLVESNIASAKTDNVDSSAGLSIHDLVHDYAVRLAKGKVQNFHANLVDKYYTTTESSISNTYWQKLTGESYMTQHIVWHMLGAGRGGDALQLLTDYSWIQHLNKDETRLPFRQVMSDLAMLREYVEKNECGQKASITAQDVGVLIDTMQRCIGPSMILDPSTGSFTHNRRECSFQLYGRLASLRSDSGIIRRVMWGIEEHSARPWIRAGAGVLSSVESGLKKLLRTPIQIGCMEKGLEEDELVIGGHQGELRIIGSNDGEERCVLDGHQSAVMKICIDRGSGEIYSCSSNGFVKVWKNSVHRCFNLRQQMEGMLFCAAMLPTRGVLAVGWSTGIVQFVDKKSGSVLKCVDGHNDYVGSLAVGESEKVMVSGSSDRTLRIWDMDTWTPIGDALTGHTDEVKCVALSADEGIIASASADKSVRLWSVQERQQTCQPLIGHNYGVYSVVFSSDAKLLCSATLVEVIVWDVKSVPTGFSKIRRFNDTRMRLPYSLLLNDDSQLFAGDFTSGSVYVWDMQSAGNEDSSVTKHSFVADIEAFGISHDGVFMAAFNKTSEEIELRRVQDVLDENDHVVNKFKRDIYFSRVAVGNGGDLIAYCDFSDLTVYVVDISSGDTLHTLSGAEDWAKSLRNRDDIFVQPIVYCLYFNAEGTVLSAEACAQLDDGERLTRSLQWNVNSSSTLQQPVLGNTQISMSVHSGRHSRLFCNRGHKSYLFSSAIQMIHNNSNVTAATLDHTPWDVSYSPHAQRFWASKYKGGLEHVQLVTEETKLQQWPEPQLPALCNSRNAGVQSHHTSSSKNDPGKKGSVFLSHAGPDKDTMAQVLYDKLVELGFEVFFDREELQPGQHAPRRMEEEMKSATIAVVILSPEFAARRWTMIELLCFLKRFEECGERGVIIIPVFYRLGVAHIRDIKIFLSVVGESGVNVFEQEGYWEREGREGGSIKDIFDVLQKLRCIMGIENSNGATNGKGEEERKKRMEIIELIVVAVLKGQKRLDDGSAAGPNSPKINE